MKILVGDTDGAILGRADITGTVWRVVGSSLTNDTVISVQIARAGIAAYTAFIDDDDCLLQAPGDFVVRRQVGICDTVIFREGQMHLHLGKGLLPRIPFDPLRFPWHKLLLELK